MLAVSKCRESVRKLAKAHWLDAYIGSWIGQENAKIEIHEVLVYRFVQFRRHSRQLIHARRDRNYYKDKKIVAKNRRKRCGQLEESLEEFGVQMGEQAVSKLGVTAGKKMIRHKRNKSRGKKKSDQKDTAAFEKSENEHRGKRAIRDFLKEYRPGDLVFLENGEIGVVRASNHKGYSILLWGKKDYVVAAKCKLVRKNTGLICVDSALKSKKDWQMEETRQ